MSEIQHSDKAYDAAAGHYRLLKPVVMVGMMGAGKTAVGRALAARLAVPFMDSDIEIEAAANLTIPEIFERDGEAFFREKETQVIHRLLAGPPCVLSTGGGAYLAERNRAEISQHGAALWIRANLDLLWQRVRHKATRPLLRTENPRATLEALYADRAEIYALAELQITAEAGQSVEDMVDLAIAALLARRDILKEVDDA